MTNRGNVVWTTSEIPGALQGLLVGQLEAEKTQRRAALRFGELLEELL